MKEIREIIIPTIIIDTREKQPYAFNVSKALSVRAKLQTGDYSLQGYEKMVALERKSLADYVKTVTLDRRRFCEELKRMTKIPWTAIVVEGTLEDIFTRRYDSGIHPMSIYGATLDLIVTWAIPVFFLSNRQLAAIFTQDYLLKVWEQIKKLEQMKKKAGGNVYADAGNNGEAGTTGARSDVAA